MSAAEKLADRLQPIFDERFNREVVNGVEMMSPRPAVRHAAAASRLGMMLTGNDQDLGPPGGGPGGWWILDEPELWLQGEDPIVPDLAGWRVDRVPDLPDAANVKIAPDWLCEVLSPSTEEYDRVQKLKVYGEQKVGWVWLLDPLVRTLEVFRLDGESYRLHKVHGSEEIAATEPFTATPVNLPLLWLKKK